MTDAHESTQAATDESVQPAAAVVTDPSRVPMDDAAGRPTAGKEQPHGPSEEEEAAAQLGDFA